MVQIHREDSKKFLSTLERNHTKYELVDSQESNDGSLFIKLKKKYNNYSTEGYIGSI